MILLYILIYKMTSEQNYSLTYIATIIITYCKLGTNKVIFILVYLLHWRLLRVPEPVCGRFRQRPGGFPFARHTAIASRGRNLAGWELRHHYLLSYVRKI